MRIAIVGAGLAGLTCAKVLGERGAEVAVFEASDDIGGRVRTDERDGFLLERGFQVYFTSYPVARRHLDYGALDFREFDRGAILRKVPQKSVLSYPDADFRPLAVYRIPYGQFAQPPGIHSRLPENRTRTPGLVLAGEYTEDASINGSMLSGEKAAEAVLA